MNNIYEATHGYSVQLTRRKKKYYQYFSFIELGGKRKALKQAKEHRDIMCNEMPKAKCYRKNP